MVLIIVLMIGNQDILKLKAFIYRKHLALIKKMQLAMQKVKLVNHIIYSLIDGVHLIGIAVNLFGELGMSKALTLKVET